jgi:competence protein ComFC
VALRALADTILSLLLAPPCAVCGSILERPLSGAVCESCWNSISPDTAAFSLPFISCAQALGQYDATLRDVIHVLKYDGRRSIAPTLSRMMAQHAAGVLHGADLVVPVPLHPRRHRQRGFNQADDLARGLGVHLNRALRRLRATQPQIELPAEQRRDNVRLAFALRVPVVQVARKVVVIVDDVTTTGATLEACARVLKLAGARDVRALTAARVATGRLRQRPS